MQPFGQFGMTDAFENLDVILGDPANFSAVGFDHYMLRHNRMSSA
jgi:hypothetical protein